MSVMGVLYCPDCVIDQFLLGPILSFSMCLVLSVF